jgi:hypothetical protein
MAQLDMYPLGLINCPDARFDHASHHNWRGNDCMVLGYMNHHMYPAESQCIANCTTLVEAYRVLQRHHKKCNGLRQIQLIQKLMQLHFNNTPTNCDVLMSTAHDLIYWIDQIGHIDTAWLVLPLHCSRPEDNIHQSMKH